MKIKTKLTSIILATVVGLSSVGLTQTADAKSLPNGSGSNTHYIDKQNNVFQIAPKSKTNKGKVTNSFSLKTAKGTIPIKVTTYYKRLKKNGRVDVNKVVITYKNKTKFSPYISSFLIEKKKGKPVRFKEKSKLGLGGKSGTIVWKRTVKNVQSVDLYVHPDFTGAVSDNVAGTGNRYQLYTIF